jgi:hypothetical protein
MDHMDDVAKTEVTLWVMSSQVELTDGSQKDEDHLLVAQDL